MIFLFQLCAGLIGYVYLGYPALLWVVSRFYRQPVHQENITPKVTVAIAAYNEEQTIGERIENCLALDYPADQLEVLIASDGSTDRTAEIVRGYADRGVKLLDLSRQGKALADNALVKAATGEIVVTTSATSNYPPDVLRKLVRNFADPAVGCVTGVYGATNADASSTSVNESAYWRYEMWLRHLESQLGILAISAGVALAFRPDLYQSLTPTSDADNMVPLWAVARDKRVVFEPEAIVHDDVIETPEQELRNRIRQVSKSQRDTFRIPRLLNPFLHFGSAFSLWSHKLLRWWVPFFSLGAFGANLFLLRRPKYRLMLLAQSLFYVAAAVGYILEPKGRAPRILSWAMNFCLVHVAFFVGTLNVLRRKQSHMWVPRSIEIQESRPPRIST